MQIMCILSKIQIFLYIVHVYVYMYIMQKSWRQLYVCLLVSDPVGDPGELAAVDSGDGRARHVWFGAALHILAALQRRQ